MPGGTGKWAKKLTPVKRPPGNRNRVAIAASQAKADEMIRSFARQDGTIFSISEAETLTNGDLVRVLNHVLPDVNARRVGKANTLRPKRIVCVHMLAGGCDLRPGEGAGGGGAYGSRVEQADDPEEHFNTIVQEGLECFEGTSFMRVNWDKGGSGVFTEATSQAIIKRMHTSRCWGYENECIALT
jgi:hypothetical protein